MILVQKAHVSFLTQAFIQSRMFDLEHISNA